MTTLLRLWQPIDRLLYRRRYGPAEPPVDPHGAALQKLGPRPEGIVVARADLDAEQTAAAREHYWRLIAGLIVLTVAFAGLFYALWRTGA